jgi:hypothetical protein
VPDSAPIAELTDEIAKKERLNVSNSDLDVWKLVKGVTPKEIKESFFRELKRYNNDDEEENAEKEALEQYPNGCAWRVISTADVKLLVGPEQGRTYVLIQVPKSTDEGMSYPLYLGNAKSLTF